MQDILVLFDGRIFQQTIGIPMGTNYASLLADLIIHAYDVDFLQWLLKIKYIKLTQTFNSSCHYIDAVLPRNNFRFGDYLHRIYPNELEIKDITDAQKYASYPDFHLEINNWGILKIKTRKNAITSLFQLSTSPSSVAIFEHRQRI
jgi:hypothetical protein